MSGIYPDYIGPSIEYRHASRFPRWIQQLGGGVVIPPLPWLGGALVLPPTYGIAMVASTLGHIVGRLYAAVRPINSNISAATQGQPGVEVKDEEPGI